jgi:hypothetical protein
MIAMWTDIASGAGLYWVISVFASVLQVFLLIGAFIGGGSDFDHGADAHDGSTADSVRIFSFRILVAFFVGFGWAGVLGQRAGMAPGATATAAAISGVVFMLLLFVTLRLLMSMRDDGSLHYENAIGLRGQVYVTIPAKREGIGQIEVLLQGRLITANAVTDSETPLAPQHGIEITALMPPNTFVVKPTS